MKLKNILHPVIIIVLAAGLRLIPHPANVAPIAAMALFGGAYLGKKNALLIPLIALFVSDLFLGLHRTMPFVYGSFLLTGLCGMWLKGHKTFQNVLLITLLSSTQFFIITNLGVWLVGSLYPKTLSGLLLCYTYAIPFFRNTLLGDLLYTGVFFGGYEVVTNFLPKKLYDKNLH